ncbi:hypothetical protein HMPREF1624_02879 [Sporothrix schenckii ATCC 58251]|uniref:2EXR domain-containing protein n=1 Tax=Sporothrix schenckii (strain ATCC 58251 / de Perez 2211183) TaxID=1391915 RepID=U7Q374_SPOS1|nr:hypothetical protein HMPREF1624_02879 [Sporothrix schenckii ATCC 58251]
MRQDEAQCPTQTQTFPRFSQLPPELRLKIWEYSLPEPRIVSVRCGAKTPLPSPSSSSPSSSSLSPRRRGHALDDCTACSPACSSPASSSSSPSPLRLTSPLQSPSPSPPPPPPPPPQSVPPPPSTTSSPPCWCTSPAPLPPNLHVCHESRVEALRRYARMFGIARQPGHVYFDPERDILYFGPRDGYMAAEAQLRTLLVLADPEELTLVERVALSEGILDLQRLPSSSALTASSLSPLSSSTSPASTNLAVDVLHQLRTRLPNLRELFVVPLEENLVGRVGATVVEAESATTDPNAGTERPAAAATSHLALHMRTALRRVCAAAPDWTPPRWRILVTDSSDNAQSRRAVGRQGMLRAENVKPVSRQAAKAGQAQGSVDGDVLPEQKQQ